MSCSEVSGLRPAPRPSLWWSLKDGRLHRRPVALTGCHAGGRTANGTTCLRPDHRRSVAAHARSTVEPHTIPVAGTCPGHVRAHRSAIHGGGMNFGIPVVMSIVHSELWI
jgi:hypothetical protein